jgi:hypothetical protein
MAGWKRYLGSYGLLDRGHHAADVMGQMYEECRFIASPVPSSEPEKPSK